MIKPGTSEALKLLESEPVKGEEITIHQPVSYVPYGNFWIRTIAIKISKKYQIDIQKSEQDKIFIIFIKDADLEHFSIYAIKC